MGTFKFKIDGKWLKIPTVQGKKGEKGDKPIAGLDYFTEEDKEVFKQAVVEDSKTEINEHTETKKIELDNYTTELETNLKTELDTYTVTKETELDTHKTALETEMSTTKDNLVQEIETEINTLTEEKQTEINNNATAKINEFNENTESYEKRIADLEHEEVTQTVAGTELTIKDAKESQVQKLYVIANSKYESEPTPYNPQNYESISELQIQAINNLFDKTTVTSGWLGTNLANNAGSEYRKSDYIKVEGYNSIDIYSDDYSDITANIAYIMYDFQKNAISAKLCPKSNASIKIPEAVSYIRYSLHKNQLDNLVISPKYQKIDIDLQGNLLNKIQIYKDYLLIDKLGNIKLFYRPVQTKSLTGNERITISSNAFPCFVIGNGTIDNSYKECTHFYTHVGVNYNSSDMNHTVYSGSGNLFFRFDELISKGVDAFKTFLKEQYENGTPVTFSYITKNVEFKVLDLGKVDIRLFEGANELKVVTNLGEADIQVTYIQDLDLRIKNIENAILSLGGNV